MHIKWNFIGTVGSLKRQLDNLLGQPIALCESWSEGGNHEAAKKEWWKSTHC